MIILFCLLAAASLGGCIEPLPNREEIEMSINRTIDEVERLVRDDPSLPRLSRTQIVDILFNITTQDMNSYENSVEQTRENYQRALMVVMPYKANDTKDESLKDLYTKPPIVQIFKDTTGTPEQTTKTPEAKKVTPSYHNHRETYTEVSAFLPTKASPNSLPDAANSEENEPKRFTFNLGNFGERVSHLPLKNSVETTTKAIKSDLQIVYSTSVTERPTTKVVKSQDFGAEGFRPTMPPTRSTPIILTSDQWRYNAPPSTAKPLRHSSYRNRKKPTLVPFLPTMMTEQEPISSTQTEASSTTRVTPREKEKSPWDMENLRIVDENEKPAPLFVTPMSSMEVESTKASVSAVTSPEIPDPTVPMREEVQELLASIGLHPKQAKGNQRSKEGLKLDHEKIFGTNFKVPEPSKAMLAQASELAAVGVEPPSINNQNTFERTPQDVKKGVENLSPDVQLLFQRFGLQSSAKDQEKATTTTARPPSPTEKTFWNNFKPLPTSEVKDEGMKEFLAKFGLGTATSRNDRAMKTKQISDKPPSLIEAVPSNMKNILENIGLITRPQQIQATEPPILNVFKPHETSIDNLNQREKINDLLDTVRLVQEGKADVSAVQKAAKDLLDTTKSLKNGPDPLSLEEILQLYNDDVKNEIKRQQDPKDLLDTAVSVSTTSSPQADDPSNVTDSAGAPSDPAASSDTSEPKSPSDNASPATETSNIDALADSFGGSTAKPDPVLPPPRKTGLYFLVDWNTFLEVGEEGKDKVNLRFQPKAGDRTRFLTVTIP